MTAPTLLPVAASSLYLTPRDLRQAYTAEGADGVDFSLYTDDGLADLITRACGRIDGHLGGITLRTRVYREMYRGTGTNFLRLRQWPLPEPMVVQTQLSADAAHGASTITLDDASGLLPKQFLIASLDPGGTGLAQALGQVKAVYDDRRTVDLVLPTAAAYGAGQPVAVAPIDYISIILPGGVRYPIPTGTLIVEGEVGIVQNWTPLMFQTLGYTSVFPLDMPLEVQYTAGWGAQEYGQPFPQALRTVVTDLCVGMVRNIRSKQLGGLESVHQSEQTIHYAAPKGYAVGDLSNEHKRMLTPFNRTIGVA